MVDTKALPLTLITRLRQRGTWQVKSSGAEVWVPDKDCTAAADALEDKDAELLIAREELLAERGYLHKAKEALEEKERERLYYDDLRVREIETTWPWGKDDVVRLLKAKDAAQARARIAESRLAQLEPAAQEDKP